MNEMEQKEEHCEEDRSTPFETPDIVHKALGMTPYLATSFFDIIPQVLGCYSGDVNEEKP